MKMRTELLVPCLFAAIIATPLAGCDEEDGGGAGGTGGVGGSNIAASAVIEPRSGSSLKGMAYFTVNGDDVTVQVDVTNAAPGEHAVHIHEIPDCSAEDAMSAGDHWNPTMEAHGHFGDPPFHLGDIGNIMVGDDGKGSISLRTDLWTVGTGEENDVVNHSLVVHEDPDDFMSQPAGNAGARIGCGVIEQQ